LFKNAGQIYNIRIGNKSVERVEQFKYFGIAINKPKLHS
jgi:hypothetical protein